VRPRCSPPRDRTFSVATGPGPRAGLIASDRPSKVVELTSVRDTGMPGFSRFGGRQTLRFRARPGKQSGNLIYDQSVTSRKRYGPGFVDRERKARRLVAGKRPSGESRRSKKIRPNLGTNPPSPLESISLWKNRTTLEPSQHRRDQLAQLQPSKAVKELNLTALRLYVEMPTYHRQAKSGRALAAGRFNWPMSPPIEAAKE
jgi:hypothetical protein